MEITGIDHIVLTVEDVEETVAFYERLGGEGITFDGGRRGIAFGDQKINLHPADDIYTPHANTPEPGTDDFCLIVTDPIKDVQAELEANGIEIIHGPTEKVGALGSLHSVYVRDPDGNLVELARYQ